MNIEGQKIEVSGIKIHYEKVGSGSKILLFLPGGCGKLIIIFN